MSQSNSVDILYVAESTFGTTPAAPTMKRFPRTTGMLKAERAITKSQTIRTDRMRDNIYSTGTTASGDMAAELVSGRVDDLIAAALCSTFSASINLSSTDFSFSTTDDSINRTTGSFVSDGIIAGMWVKTGGSAANSTYLKVLTVAALKVTVDYNLTTEAAGPTVTIKNHGSIRNGILTPSFTFEQGLTDLAEYTLFTGCRINTMNITVPAVGLATIQFGILGKNFPGAEAGSTGASAVTAYNSKATFNGCDDWERFTEASTVVTDDISEFSLSVNSNLRRNQFAGNPNTGKMPYGTQDVTGALKVYYENSDITSKARTFEESSLSLILENTNSGVVDTLIMTVPGLKYTSGSQPEPGGENTDVMANLTYEAFAGSRNYHVQFDRFSV